MEPTTAPAPTYDPPRWLFWACAGCFAVGWVFFLVGAVMGEAHWSLWLMLVANTCSAGSIFLQTRRKAQATLMLAMAALVVVAAIGTLAR